MEDEFLFPEIVSSCFRSIHSFSMNHIKLSKAKIRCLKKRAKARLSVMDKVVDRPSDVPPSTLDEDLSVKDEVAVWSSDEPDEDLPMQDDVVDRLSDAPPSNDLACDRSALSLYSVPSKKLNIIRFAPLSRSKRRRLNKKHKFRLKNEDMEDSTVKPPSSSSHAGVSPPFGVSSPAITPRSVSEGVVDSEIQLIPTPPVGMRVKDKAFRGTCHLQI